MIGLVMTNSELNVYTALKVSTLSNSEIADKCGVARSTVRKWRLGSKIKSDNLIVLCEVLNIQLDDLTLNNTTTRERQSSLISVVQQWPEDQDEVLVVMKKMLVGYLK